MSSNSTATRLSGTGTIAFNRVHPSRFAAVVEVAPDYRRRGVGTSLIDRLRALRADDAPLYRSDAAAMALVANLGGRSYQHCPVVSVDPGSDEVRAWVDDSRHDVVVGDLRPLSAAAILDHWIDQYVWVHESWAPAGDDAVLREVFADITTEVDVELSTVATVDGRVAAMAFAFGDGQNNVEVVAETATRGESGGASLVRSVVARTGRLPSAGHSARRVRRPRD